MSIRMKTILGLSMIQLLLCMAIFTLSFRYLTHENKQRFEQQVQSTLSISQTLTLRPILANDLIALRKLLTTLVEQYNMVYAEIRSPNKVILAQSGDRASLNNLTAENKVALDQVIVYQGTPIAFATLYFDLTETNTQMETIKHNFLALSFITVLIIIAIAYCLGHYLTRSLSKLEQAALKVASGERTFTWQSSGNDEISVVVKAFRHMIDKLCESEQISAQYQRALEQQVQRKSHSLKETSDALTLAQRQLVDSQKMAAIGVMSAGVAHEINNPIGIIHSNLQLCKEYLVELEDQTVNPNIQNNPQTDDRITLINELNDCIDDSLISANRVRTIIEKLSHYASDITIDEGNSSSCDIVFPLFKAIEELDTLNEVQIKTDHSLYSLPKTTGREARLKALFVEVLKNAINACHKSPHDQPKVITISSRQEQTQFSIFIHNTGPFIDEKDLEHIFEPFFTTQKVGNGAGLGLTHAYDIMKRYNGKIEIANHPKVGVEVALTFQANVNKDN
ncbi:MULTISPECIES: ATP-binding protein [unclassified Vibrio]|uniref:histidine kinase n=1 Tax=Vibrio sp. HB236076 TaxID=3232307 RepID=A0AB39HED5_9VIBR|nr:ATP-binding protein [Vibrio sp. HB161653]MDP5252697.1 ATP-binding protein [Vibrio sp. HB161653]